MVEVKKKSGESPESMLRRFTKRVQQSGVLIRAKKGRYFEPPKNKRAKKEDAKRRQEARAKKEYLRKIGKLEEMDKKRGRRRRK